MSPLEESSTPQSQIVIIEDDADIRTVLMATLKRKASFEVHAADTGKSGIDLVQTVKPDAVVLDFALPDMTGASILDALKASQETAGIPVYVMTGNRSIEHCLEKGAAKIFYKPFDIFALTDELIGACRSSGSAVSSA